MATLFKKTTMQWALNASTSLERRSKPRVSVPFRATVQGTDVDGVYFELTTNLDNLSAGGLYLRLANEVRVGSRLLVNVHLNAHGDTMLAEGCLVLEVYGPVARVDPVACDSYGVAVTFSNSVLF
jgi:hypothetical protein